LPLANGRFEYIVYWFQLGKQQRKMGAQIKELAVNF
jgi:hypothetical protein